MSNQKTTIEIARMLSRDHRTIKNLVQKASKVRSRSDKGHFRIIKKKEMTVLKIAIALGTHLRRLESFSMKAIFNLNLEPAAGG